VLGKYLFNEAPQAERPTVVIFFSQKLQLKMGRTCIRYGFIGLFWFLLLEICFLFSEKIFYESVPRCFYFGLVRTVTRIEVIEMIL
jgi:hypothetical protein